MHCLFTYDVGFTTHRPVRPDERVHRVTVPADDDDPNAALLFALQWIAQRPGVVMVTSATLVSATL